MPIVEASGVRVEYAQSGAGPDLLMLHSLLTDLTVFDQVLPHLARSRRVTCINLPGFGASGALDLKSVADHAGHVARAMDGLRLPVTSAVFGNGFGAFVALELALGHGGRFGRLLVADALACFPEPAKAPFRTMAERVRAGGMQTVLDAALARMFPQEFRDARPELMAARKAVLAAVDPDCFARACLALAALDLRPRVSAIRNRTLVLCGELDQTTPPALAAELAQAVPGAAFRLIAGCGHCPMLERPQALVESMDEFLATQAGDGT